MKELATALHLFSTFSSPCFSVKKVYNYGLQVSYIAEVIGAPLHLSDMNKSTAYLAIFLFTV
jgi:hypothetical protein